jgi:hypothetical protein
MKVVLGIITTIVLVAACSSPLDLDVADRTKEYTDGAVNPKKISFFYYFGEYGFEAIVIDTAILNSIWVIPDGTLNRVTIPRFEFNLPDTLRPGYPHSPFVNSLSFSTENWVTNGILRKCVNADTWFKGTYMDQFGTPITYQWPADDWSHQFRLALYQVQGQRTIKGLVQIVLEDPAFPPNARWVTYQALMTIDY